MNDWASKQLPERLPFSKKRLPKRVIFSYIGDYLIIVVLIGIFTIVDKIAPFHQQFSLDNYTLHYPYAVKERVPVFWALIYVVAAPMVIIAIYTMVIDGLFSHHAVAPTGRTGVKKLSGRYRFKDRLWELNCGILGLGLSVGAAFTITGALKNAIGKPRPDLISRCLIAEDRIVKSIGDNARILQSIAICTQQDNYILQDGFKSFPSGHASVSFAGLFYLSIYLAGKLHVLDAKGEVWRTFIVMVPTLGAALITGTRIMDARHHPFDVMFGSALGILVAWGSYRQYFPPVTETWRKGRAYPIRAWGQPTRTPPNPTIMVDEDVRPLRPMGKPIDEERGESSGYTSTTVVGGETNVFRQQISDSQRRRGGPPQYGVDRSDTGASSNYRSNTLDSAMSSRVNQYQNTMPGSTHFDPERPHPRHGDGYTESSSEDENDFELQERFNRTRPPNSQFYDQGRFTDTGYHAASGITPNPTPPPLNTLVPNQQTTMSPSGDLGERKDGPAPGPHVAGTTPQQI